MTSFNDGIEAAVTTDEARRFLECAVRNWSRVNFDRDGLEDFRIELERFRQKVLAEALKRPEPREATQAAADVLAERRRQIEAEGWTPEHDDQWESAELVWAAACYVTANPFGEPRRYLIPSEWPWDRSWWKPADHRRNLVKAGALILAEIERIDRAALAAAGGE